MSCFAKGADVLLALLLVMRPVNSSTYTWCIAFVVIGFVSRGKGLYFFVFFGCASVLLKVLVCCFLLN